MSDEKRNLPATLDITPIDNTQVYEDYKQAKAVLKNLLDQGQQALELAMQIANDTEHPRSVEVFSGLLKNIADINDKMISLDQKYKDFAKRESFKDAAEPPASIPHTTTNNIVFTGSTKDLQAIVNDMIPPMKTINENEDDSES